MEIHRRRFLRGCALAPIALVGMPMAMSVHQPPPVIMRQPLPVILGSRVFEDGNLYQLGIAAGDAVHTGDLVWIQLYGGTQVRPWRPE